MNGSLVPPVPVGEADLDQHPLAGDGKFRGDVADRPGGAEAGGEEQKGGREIQPARVLIAGQEISLTKELIPALRQLVRTGRPLRIVAGKEKQGPGASVGSACAPVLDGGSRKAEDPSRSGNHHNPQGGPTMMKTIKAVLVLTVAFVPALVAWGPVAAAWTGSDEAETGAGRPEPCGGLGRDATGASSPRSGLPYVAYRRIPNGTARASSSGDYRPPANAFDGLLTTFWRNRTHQTGIQYLGMDFNGRRYAVARISLAFGSHYPRDYRFRFKRSGVWQWGTRIVGNTAGSRVHVWRTPLRNVQAVRVYCLRYSSDDYFSVREMVIQH